MSDKLNNRLLRIAASMALCLGTIACSTNKGPGETPKADAATTTPAQSQSQPDLEKQRQDAEQAARPGVEQLRCLP
jgi:predicted small lipoprotein YifL